jgi:ABC-type transport system involved in cytochrome c biogenesis ATPase subunit
MMMLRRLELQAFGRFKDEVIEFAPGMNLVSGPNESGKTTLLQAVMAVLFGDDDAARFVPWENTGICRAALLLEAGGRQVRIERDFFTGCAGWSEADTDGEFVPVFCGCPGAEADQAAYLSRLQELLGVGRRDLFQALLYGDPSDGSSGFSPERLKACLSDPEITEYSAILKNLQAEYLAISSTNPWGLQATGEGELAVITRRLAELEKEWFALQEMIRLQKSHQVGEHSDCTGNGVAADAGTSLPQEPGAAESMPNIPEAAVTTTDVRQDEAADYATRRAELERELAKTGLPRCLPAELPELLSDCATLRQTMAEQKHGLSVRQEERRKCRPPAWQRPAMGLTGMWAGVLFWSRIQATALPIWGGVLVTVAIGAWHVRRILLARSDSQQRDSQIAVVEARVHELQQQLAAMNHRFEALGLSPSPVETVRMQKNLPRYQQLLEQLRQMDDPREAIAAAPTVTDPDLPATASVPAVEEMIAAGPDDQPVEPASAQVCCRHGAEHPPTEALTATRDSADLESLLDARSRIETEGEVLRARESRLKQRKNTLGLECDLLQETLAGFPGTDLEDFAGVLGQVMSRLTGGVVDKVQVTEEFVVQLPGADGAWLPVERFSSAIRTLLQLALCLSLGQLRCETARLPLLLDDPLGALDKKRRGQVLKVLEHYAAGHQVILFSHEETLRRKAIRDNWNLIPLNAGDSSPTAGKEEKNDHDGQLSFL